MRIIKLLINKIELVKCGNGAATGQKKSRPKAANLLILLIARGRITRQYGDYLQKREALVAGDRSCPEEIKIDTEFFTMVTGDRNHREDLVTTFDISSSHNREDKEIEHSCLLTENKRKHATNTCAGVVTLT
ncbi:hypothetical protein [uncultured Sneathiella sp.]|uniref:hypothetical protein n=1 Tax=uncultured Sneathiella sp. TaxID=879315 RepID=UPI0030D8346F